MMVKTDSAVKSVKIEKYGFAPKANVNKSVQYDRGDTRTSGRLQAGISARGMNMPLVKRSGNFTTLDVIITCEGLLVGADASNVPSAAKQNPARITAGKRIKISGKIVFVIKIPNTAARMSSIIPKQAPEIISPRMMARWETGLEIRRSYVLAFRSQGVIRGSTAVAVKKRTMASIQGTAVRTSISRPTTKASRKKTGKSRPAIKTGGFI